MDSTTHTIRARAARLAFAVGETFDALDYDRRVWWEDVAGEASRMVDAAANELLDEVAEDGGLGALQRRAFRESARENARALA